MADIFAAKFRKKLAGWMLGEQVALFLPSATVADYQRGEVSSLTDCEVASITRFWFASIRKLNEEIAAERIVPASVFIRSQAAMALVDMAHSANAETMTIDQSGTIAGQDVGKWRIQVSQLPDDYEFGAKGVQKTWDGDRLTELILSYSIPEARHTPNPTPKEG